MLLIYSVIIFLILSLAGITALFLTNLKKSRATYEKQQHTIATLKMQTIRNRLSPHFMFNALSTLSGPAHDPQTISQNIKTLLMLLRQSVDNIEQTAIPLSEELEVVKGYIGLQSLRLPEPIKITFDIGQNADVNQLIPAMIIQIPVENAIKHGLMPIIGEKILSIRVQNYDGGIEISVEDNGIGYSSSPNRSMGSGTGLKILYQAIGHLNSKNVHKITVKISDLKETIQSQQGTIVRIRVPEGYSYDIS